MAYPVLVLCYHAISEQWQSAMSTTPARLERHVRWLLRRGYAPTTFAEAAHGAHAGPCFAVTFDDAFASVRERAFGVLARLGVPATVFVPTRFADDGGPLRWDGLEGWAASAHEHELRSMGWADLVELRRAGWEIGSHTVTHPRLPDLEDAQLTRELTQSKRRCEQMVDAPCRSVAYPYGAADERVARAARDAGYDAGAMLGSPPRPGGGPLRVPRVGVGHRDRPLRFAVKTSPAVLALRARIGA